MPPQPRQHAPRCESVARHHWHSQCPLGPKIGHRYEARGLVPSMFGASINGKAVKEHDDVSEFGVGPKCGM